MVLGCAGFAGSPLRGVQRGAAFEGPDGEHRGPVSRAAAVVHPDSYLWDSSLSSGVSSACGASSAV